MNQTQSSTFVDPFEEQSFLDLNRRTHRLSKDALKSNDLEAAHQYMKSMASQSPDKHFEQAKSVIDGSLEVLNTKKGAANMKEKQNPQQRRPGLDRKRAKFSMKPDTRQSSTIVEPTLEVDHLQDPEEFYEALEKFENTRKELKRLRGEKDEDEVKTSTTVRGRRPELPRRKVSYKHREYSSQSQDDMSFTQETLQDNLESQTTQSSQQESLTPNLQREEEKETRSITNSEKRVHKLFDELMDSNIHELDENQTLSLLKDRMNIKPVDIPELQLPKFHEAPKLDFISPVKNLPKRPQSKLSDTFVLPDITNRKSVGTQKRLSDNLLQSLGSPTPSKSPFLAISKFGKNMMKTLISKDPFSSDDVDSPPVSPRNIIGGESSHASKDKEVPVLDTLHPLENKKITETAIGDMEDTLMDQNMEERDVDDNETDIQRNEDINGNAEDMLEKEASITEVILNVEDLIEEEVIEENVEDVTEKAEPSSVHEVNFEPEEVNAEVEVNVEVSEVEELSQPAETNGNSIEHMDTSGPTQSLVDIPEQQNEAEEQIPTPRTRTKKKKKIARKPDRKKSRQSLAGAGSSWTTSGVRKSTRIKQRPLEYWNGERFLKARVHNSLPTVIGVKYMSPGKSGFRVESFVSNKFKDLVDLTALH